MDDQHPSLPTSNLQPPTSRKGIGGPTTPEGKAKVSLNAMKHGLTAESPQGLEEVAEMVGKTFEQVFEDMNACYQPADAIEETLVRRIARCAWRMLMTETMEDHIICRRGFHTSVGKSRERLIRYERLTDIQLHRAIEALQRRREFGAKTSQNKLISGLIPSVGHAQQEPEFVLP